MNNWPIDLKFAQITGYCVDVWMRNGQHYVTGVQSVHDEQGTAYLYDPQNFGDETTRTRIRLSDVVALRLSNITW